MYRPTHISTSAPTVNDDFDSGFRNGNYWWRTTTEALYILEDDSVGAADWVAIASGDVGTWADFTPSFGWTGNTPTGVTYVARYITIGDICMFTVDVSFTTGGSGNLTDMGFSLPETVADNDNLIPISSYYDVAGVYANVNIPYVDGATPAGVKHAYFPTIGTTQACNFYFRGFYEYV